MGEHLVLCGDVANRRRPANGDLIRLALHGSQTNIRLRLQDIARRLLTNIPPLLTDLIEIASYVHCADQAISRGGEVRKSLGADWRRRFRFVIPVRDPVRWSSPEVLTALTNVLGFLSEDEFRFEFTKQNNAPSLPSYFDFAPSEGSAFQADEIILFSGGLDSLAGAITELGAGHRIALVSHSSAPKIQSKQTLLAAELGTRFPGQVLHVPILVTRQDAIRQPEETQRTRTFLFGALAATAARIFGRNRIRFYENGIVSFNLPIAGQVIGTQATRTTHPHGLRELERFLSLLLNDGLTVDNPFTWKTKTEIISIIKATGHADLVRDSISCSHVHAMTTLHTHCGVCSQCLDRRFAALAAGLGQDDPAEMYGVDLLTGPRKYGQERTLAESYVRAALEFRRMEPNGFLSKFAGEVSRAAFAFPGMSPDAVVRATFDLYRRHGATVHSVLTAGVREYANALVDGALPDGSVLKMAVGQHGREFDNTSIKAPILADLDGAKRDTRNFGQTREIRLTLNDEAHLILIQGIPPIRSRAHHSLVSALVKQYREDLLAERPPEKYRFTPSLKLAATLHIEEQALRRRAARLRKVVAEMFERDCGVPLEQDAILQSKSWRGYRLNPAVRLVTEPDIEAKSHDLPRKGHDSPTAVQ